MNNKESIQGPKSVGLIMDGNRRWAKAKNLLSKDGHRAGRDKLKQVAQWAIKEEVTTLIPYAFSTENWTRPQEEISALWGIMADTLTDLCEFDDEKIKLMFFGDRERLPAYLSASMAAAELKTRAHNRLTMAIGISYGGRKDIAHAASALAREGMPITEESIGARLSTAGFEKPELIIRTGGEHRLSNFLLWESSYTELAFSDTLWPDFSQNEFNALLEKYRSCKQNNGR